MKKINLYKLLSASAILVVLMGSCRKDPVVGGTATQSLAGEWWVKLDDGTGEFGNDYYPLNTFNTSDNTPNQMWIDDQGSFGEIKGKVGCNASAQTFGSNKIVNTYYESTFNIKNGKVLLGAAKASGTGDKTDSIYFQISFSDEDPTLFHKVAGYKRTGFDEDDH